jgi:hypothetical protein
MCSHQRFSIERSHLSGDIHHVFVEAIRHYLTFFLKSSYEDVASHWYYTPFHWAELAVLPSVDFLEAQVPQNISLGAWVVSSDNFAYSAIEEDFESLRRDRKSRGMTIMLDRSGEEYDDVEEINCEYESSWIRISFTT